MSLTLKLNHPHLEEGAELGVAGAFEVKNGESVELTKEQEAEYISMHGMTIEDAFSNQSVWEVSGTPEIKDISEVLSENQVNAINNMDRAAFGLTTDEEETTSTETEIETVDLSNADTSADNTTTTNEGDEH